MGRSSSRVLLAVEWAREIACGLELRIERGTGDGRWKTSSVVMWLDEWMPFPLECIINDAAEFTASKIGPVVLQSLCPFCKPSAIADKFFLCIWPLTCAKYSDFFISMLTCRKETTLIFIENSRNTQFTNDYLLRIWCT